MNHSSTIASIAKQVNESSLLTKYKLPFILGEANSFSSEGKSGLSNSFGAVSTLVFYCHLQMVSPILLANNPIIISMSPFPEYSLPTTQLS
jgi:hypothetical protein